MKTTNDTPKTGKDPLERLRYWRCLPTVEQLVSVATVLLRARNGKKPTIEDYRDAIRAAHELWEAAHEYVGTYTAISGMGEAAESLGATVSFREIIESGLNGGLELLPGLSNAQDGKLTRAALAKAYEAFINEHVKDPDMARLSRTALATEQVLECDLEPMRWERFKADQTGEKR